MSMQCFYKLGVLTYFQINRDYIAEVLCINKDEPEMACHGQCFLKNKLDLADDPAPAENTVPPTKQSVDFPVFLTSENVHTSRPFVQTEVNYSPYRYNTSSPHYVAPFHPPKVNT